MSISVDQKNIKALALDLDGTILTPGTELSDRTIRAIKACRQRGLRIIIATGRAIEATERFRKALDVEGPIVCFNGAVVVDMPKGKILKTTLVDKNTMASCADFSRETGVYFQVFFPPEFAAGKIVLMTEREGPEQDMYFSHTGLRAVQGDLKEALGQPGLEGCIKGMFVAEPEVLASIRPKLAERFGKSVYMVQALRNFLEIMNAKISKGEGLKIAMEHYSLKREEVIAFGDDENDLSMFAAAGFSAVPSSARDTIKSEADLVVGSNAEDGVAAFLEEFFGLKKF